MQLNYVNFYKQNLYYDDFDVYRNLLEISMRESDFGIWS